MAVNALVQSFVKNPDGSIKVTWEDGHSMPFLNLAAIREFIGELDTDPVVAERIALAWFLARQPDASNVNIIEGKRVTFDLSAANAIRVQ